MLLASYRPRFDLQYAETWIDPLLSLDYLS